MKTIVFAYHNMGIAGLEALAGQGYDIAAVFTHEDDLRENCWFGSVKEWARQRNLPVYTPEEINSSCWVEKIKEFNPDIIFSFYYRKMIAGEILAIPRAGAFNLHGSLLPHYRGRCPVNWVLINGEEKTGVTLHFMIDKPDAGDIVGQKEVAIDFTDTAKTLYGKLCLAATSLLDDLLPEIKKGKIARRKQNLSEGSYYGGRKPEDGRIDWSKPASEIYNLIRAVTDPYPGAFALPENNEKMIIWQATPEENAETGIPGSINIRQEEVLVKTGKNAIKLLDIEVAEKRIKGGIKIGNYFRDGKVTRLK
ncbi:MAG: Bifunctional polymyxin resistance protein ArnA [Smithella sp. PtaU1.Bin162]|nr:MAG: Bifunctional polymyxin resistance protein ArnA [Smithella sp. PtaU1.Bin162]